MSLIKCPECGKEISDRSVSCISCGFPLANIATDELVALQQKETEQKLFEEDLRQKAIEEYESQLSERELVDYQQKKAEQALYEEDLRQYAEENTHPGTGVTSVSQTTNQKKASHSSQRSGCLIPMILFNIFWISMVIFALKDDSKVNTRNISTQTARVQHKRTIQKISSKKIKHEIVKTYSDIGRTWKIVVIPKGISKRDLIILAKQLHRKHPKTSFNIFENNNRKKIKQYIVAQKHPGNKKYSYPERWLNKHDRGMVNKMLVGSVMRWQLYHTYEGKISDL